MDGPDFICVGMAKSGTGWLSDQLRGHPQVWMPPVGEIGYLAREKAKLKRADRMVSRLEQGRIRGRKLEDRDVRFVKELAALSDKPRDLESYIALFRGKGELKSGDVSPGYCMMRRKFIVDVTQRLAELRVVLLVRDPVARFWSHLSMWHRQGDIDAEVSTSPDKLRAYLKETKMAGERSMPSRLVAHWRQAAPALKFQHFFFDDIAGQPEDARRQMFSFIGIDPARTNGLPASYNRKSKTKKLALTEPLQAVLVEHYAEELRAAAAELGGPARDWAAKYGI